MMKRFTLEDQLAFAELSRDRNPVHVDPIAARKTLFGQPIVHGMHLVLLALEAAARARPLAYRNIKARFHKPVFLHEDVHLRLEENAGGLDVFFESGGAQLTVLKLDEQAAFENNAWTAARDTCLAAPRDLKIEEMVDLSGRAALPQDPAGIGARFPAASALYGTNRLAALLGITYVIGMEVPGLHSMFATLSVSFAEGSDNELGYRASRVNPKLSHVQIKFENAAIAAMAEVFIRPQTGEIDLASCRGAVDKGEFSGRKALIVGGSRGLGLLTANLLGAGGAEVVITFRNGEQEAHAAVQKLTANGISAHAVRLDIAEPESALAELATRGDQFTDLFYFATPHIFVRKKKLFENNLLEGFLNAYTRDFLAIIEGAKALSSGGLSVFYPSSDALNNPLKDLAEYYVAKMAGEAVCDMLNRYDDTVTVTVRRLPRLPTDQTATLMKVATEDPVTVMLDICRATAKPTSP